MLFKKYAGILIMLVFIRMDSFPRDSEIIYLWTSKIPDEDILKYPVRLYPDTTRGVLRITDITDPIITVYAPHGKHNFGTGVIVCPSGGYKYLAINIEEEIAKWLNQLGITAFVLQYRVPGKQKVALQDVQRALRIIRINSANWKLDINKIGIIGFSAGGNLAARAATSFNEITYSPVDNIDSISSWADYALLIYPSQLASVKNQKIISQLTVDKHTPPMFLFVASDDPFGIPLQFADALYKAKVPFELHVSLKRGHGYGLRQGNAAAEAWPVLAEKWVKQILYNNR